MSGDGDAPKLVESIHHNAEVRIDQIKSIIQFIISIRTETCIGPAKASVPLFGGLEC